MASLGFTTAIPAIGMLALAGLFTNRRGELLAQSLVVLCLAAAGLSLASLAISLTGQSGGLAARDWTIVPGCAALYVDRLALVMSLMISMIGAVIARYSQHYLYGDPRQGSFYRFLATTLGASLLLVVSGNLAGTVVAWVLTSVGLHGLLTHHRERPWAIWAARKKFLISRVGDVLLLAALIQTYRCFGTLDYARLFDAALAIGKGLAETPAGVAWIGGWLALGAMTKSAQFPFHSWLPDTLETPTPVSALMHAGVINAGGFLVIRLSPLMVLSPVAMHLLAAVGAFTALFAAVVMLTQPSIKRVLAYSTISQMGFMMLQCGLGAWTAALLHILAHSAYKSYAFLSSGSALDEDAATSRELPGTRLATLCSTVLTAALFGLFATTLSSGVEGRSQEWLLLFIAGLAMVHLLRASWSASDKRLLMRSIALVMVLVTLIAAGHWGTSLLLADTAVSATGSMGISLSPWLTGSIAAAFLFVFLLEGNGWRLWSQRLSQALYVHASNGFYLDIPPRRITAWVYRQRGAVP